MRRFARWQVLRRLRTQEQRGILTHDAISAARVTIVVTVRLMGWLAQSGTPITEITQADLDRDVEQHHGRALALAPFLSWCARTGLGQELTAHDPTRHPAGGHPWPMTTGGPTSNCCCTTTRSDCTAASRACSSCSTPKSWPGSLACVPSRSASPPVVSSPLPWTRSLSSYPSRSTVSRAPT